MVACSDGVVVFIDCIAERKESLGYTKIAGTEGRIHFGERRGLWEYGPLVEADEGYGTRYEFEPIPDMPAEFKLDDYFYSATRESIDCLLEDREAYPQAATASKRSKSSPPSTSPTRPARR